MSVSHHSKQASTLLAALLFLVILSTMLGCDGGTSGDSPSRSQNPPAPNDNNQDPDSNLELSVNITKGLLSSPLTSQFPELPSECNNIQFLHYTPTLDINNEPYQRDTRDADNIFFFMPGLLAGAGAFNYFAEQLVLEAHQQQQVIEVFSVDRRDQCLRDTKGLEEAEKQRDIMIAVDYYYNGSEINGEQFQGVKKSKDLPWLADMGLGLVQEDLMSLLQHYVPNPLQRQQKVFIGGHSLGGLLTHSFTGWDFDDDISTTDDAGFNQAAGFIRLDIDVTPKLAELDNHLTYGQNGFDVDQSNAANVRYRNNLDKLISGRSSRINALPGIDTETFFLLEMAAMVAHWAPKEEASLLQELPIGGTTNLMLKLIHSDSLGNFIGSNPGIRDFRYTNEALLGIIFDDDFMPVSILQTSLGFLEGGSIETKSFPVNPTLSAIIDFFVPDLGNLLTKEQLYIATEPQTEQVTSPLYQWRNFDIISNEIDTLTTEEEEMTDIASFAESIYKGPGTFTEWYMSARVPLELDIISGSTPIQGIPYWHAKAAREKPLLEIVGERGLATVKDDIEPLGQLIVAAGYNHMDLLTASNEHKDRRENEVIAPILDFARQHTSSAP